MVEEIESQFCDCCQEDRDMEDGDNCSHSEEGDGWVCRDCLDSGRAEEEGWE